MSASMHEMLEQKNRLAYDKGRLQKAVEQLQEDMELCGSSEAELGKLKECHRVLEAKYTKVCVCISEVIQFVCHCQCAHMCMLGVRYSGRVLIDIMSFTHIIS